MRRIGVGLTLQPDELFLDLLDEAIHADVDYVEVAPETLWRHASDAELAPNGYHARLRALRDEAQLPCVAHGVGLSVGSVDRPDAELRLQRWLARVRADHTDFGFLWYTDHLGASALDGLELVLPLPLLMTQSAVQRICARLARLQAIVPDVGLENTVAYFLLGSPLDEARFVREIVTSAPRNHLLLDLHNLHTMAHNFGFEPEAYLELLPLERVIEIHVSGGTESDPGWLASGQRLRLDSHDSAVPEPVWSLLEQVAPRCPHVRGITLERMEGTVDALAAAEVREELARIRDLAGGWR